MTGYTRQSAGDIVNGATIQAAHFNNEYNAVETAFNASTGHSHSGASGEGAPIPPAALAGLASSGLVVRASSTGFVARSITVASAGLAIASADGVAGNPLVTLANDLAALEGLGSSGIAVRTGTDTWAVRSLTVSTGLSITSADGSAGNMLIGVSNDLAAVEALSASGFAVRTGSETWAVRSLTVGTGLAIASADGSAGNPAISLANDIGAIEALTTNAIPARTGTDTWAMRTITGTANEITVTNGTGSAGDPTISLPSALTFTGKTITGGTYSSVTANSITIVGASITSATFLNVALIGNAGTASAPAIAVTGDTNTGIFQSTPDTLAITVGGTQRVLFGSATTFTGTVTASVGSFTAVSCTSFTIASAGNTLPVIQDSSAGGAAGFRYLQGGGTNEWQAGVGVGDGSANWNVYHSAGGVRLAVSSAGGISSASMATNIAAAMPTGSIVQTLSPAPYTSSAGLSTQLPADDTVPASTEGVEILSQAITPLFSSSRVKVVVSGFGSHTGNQRICVAVFRGSTYIGGTIALSPSGYAVPINCTVVDSPATTSATTYSVRVGPGGAAETVVLNRDAALGSRIFGGSAGVTLVVQEVK